MKARLANSDREKPTRRWFLFGAAIAAISNVVLGGAPAMADITGPPGPGEICDKKRTVAVGKASGNYLGEAKSLCWEALEAKGKAKYGSKYTNASGAKIHCTLMGGKNGDYQQCICAANICKKITFNPGSFKPKYYPQRGFTPIPHGSFGTRRAAPPSFRMPRMGPKIR